MRPVITEPLDIGTRPAHQRQGRLAKMHTRPTDPVSYELPIGADRLALNPLLGRVFRLEFTGVVSCSACGRRTPRSYGQGHCYACFSSLAACDLCIMSPHLCHFDRGTCREPDWGLEHCMRPHIVYLANSSGLKVGITGDRDPSTRWMDQGAIQALPIVRTATRRRAGELEHQLAQHVPDRTDWRRLLAGDAPPLNLAGERDRLLANLELALDAASEDDTVATRDVPEKPFSYPLLRYPHRVRAIDLHKNPLVEGTLLGIKGQYLLLDVGALNVRKHTGFEVNVGWSD